MTDLAVPRLVLDTNLLLVFIAGTLNPNLLGPTRRLKDYRVEDHATLVEYIALFQQVVLLPNIVTETSNFLGQWQGERRREALLLLARLAEAGREGYVPSRMACQQPEYLDLGVTDAAILCALDIDTYLLTNDLRLYVAALSRGHQAEYFHMLRG